MMIPAMIHQTSKTKRIPQMWARLQKKVRQAYPDWEYRLWTDQENLELVRKSFKDWEEVYLSMPKGIMRVDMIRYMYMYEFGGLYLDLDYEILRPFPFRNYELVLPAENRPGQPVSLGNSIFASVPRHPFWGKVLQELKENPPVRVQDEQDVINLTGPRFLTKIYSEYFQAETSIHIPERRYFNPDIPRTKAEQKVLEKDGTTIG
ncbi:MAG: hypothetical protein HKM06_05265, partial [Spirochaetales bacterium]|nr:hypothetical protein [Spirochaetales bacterium]